MTFKHLPERLRKALQEDGAFNDVTTRLLKKNKSQEPIKGEIIAKANGVFCGGFLAPLVMRQLSPSARVQILKKEGSWVKKGTPVVRIKAPLGAVLAGERLILNLVCHLSGVASLTRRFVDEIKGTSAQVVDTRKTTPLWRDLEKYAVTCGGGHNHRFALDDAVLIKDNHLKLLAKEGRPVAEILKKRLPRNKIQFVAMEATNYAEVWDAIKAKVDIILLDNMPIEKIKGSVVFIQAARRATGSEKPFIEITGGINLSNIRQAAQTGVDRISIGAITHSAPAMDFSLEVN
jgi:nicotinate-nucleotide pyrophosphorylase (carboxylating)